MLLECPFAGLDDGFGDACRRLAGSREQTLRSGRDLLVRGGLSPARARRLTQVNPGLLLRVGMRRMAPPKRRLVGRLTASAPAA